MTARTTPEPSAWPCSDATATELACRDRDVIPYSIGQFPLCSRCYATLDHQDDTWDCKRCHIRYDDYDDGTPTSTCDEYGEHDQTYCWKDPR